MKKDKEKEIRYLMYIKSEIIKEKKKEIKELRNELNGINKQKQLKKDRKRR